MSQTALDNNQSLDRVREPKYIVQDIVRKHMDWLEKFIETDSDDFTGMHTTKGIPDDGFYSGFYQIEREFLAYLDSELQNLRQELADEVEKLPTWENSTMVEAEDVLAIIRSKDVQE